MQAQHAQQGAQEAKCTTSEPRRCLIGPWHKTRMPRISGRAISCAAAAAAAAAELSRKRMPPSTKEVCRLMPSGGASLWKAHSRCRAARSREAEVHPGPRCLCFTCNAFGHTSSATCASRVQVGCLCTRCPPCASGWKCRMPLHEVPHRHLPAHPSSNVRRRKRSSRLHPYLPVLTANRLLGVRCGS